MITEFCSQHTQQADTPLYGTAVNTEVWILLEYDAPWTAKAVKDNSLPTEVQAWLSEQCEATSGRLLFIKKGVKHRASSTSNRLNLYIVETRQARSATYHFAANAYSDFLSLTINEVLEEAPESARSDEKLVLVCTNGKRDRCCSKFGLPVYEAFEQEEGLSTWQTTHIGGHRYSATAVAFPQGTYYGYLSPQAVSEASAALRDGKLYMPGYRGRTAYSGAVSAADYFVRKQTGIRCENGLKMISAESSPHWHITFSDKENNRHHVELIASKTEPAFASCDKPYKPQPQYEFLSYARS